MDERTAVERLRGVLEHLPEELAPPAAGAPAGRILAAPRELLAERGLAGLSMRLVAGKAGVNQAMIHYYYGTKDRLVDAVVMREVLSMIRAVVGGLDGDLEPAEVFVQYPVRMLDELRRDRVRLQLLRLVLATEPERLRRAVRELGKHGVLGVSAEMLGLIGESQQTGLLVDAAPASLLMFLIANAFGLVFMEPIAHEVMGFSLADDEAWARHRVQLTNLIRGGILAAPAGKE
jgi:AcrR family transcriptional regulator